MQWHLDGDSNKFPRIFAAEPVLVGEVAIVLCTPTMREWARRYMQGSVLVMDSTFGMNKHGYSLFAVMVIGEQSNGVPVSFLITKSESTETITTALKQFVEFLDEVSDTAEPAGHTTLTRPSTTMTDDSAAEQSALRSVYIPQMMMQLP
jgi:MULE transposase domain